MSTKKTIRLPDGTNEGLLKYIERTGKNQSSAIATLLDVAMETREEKEDISGDIQNLRSDIAELSKNLEKKDNPSKFAVVGCVLGFLNFVLLVSFAVQIF